MVEALVPSFLKPVGRAPLVRLGRAHDGGYLVDERDIMAADGVIGLGLSDDWSFEEDFCQRNDVPVLALDASISKRLFQRFLLESTARIDNPRVFAKRWRTLRSYTSFFKGNRRHVRAFVGPRDVPGFMSVPKIFATAAEMGVKKPYLKIDVEGAEYRIVNELIAHAPRTAGLVIEIHDCDLHLDRVRDFVERYPLRLVHIHANNYGQMTDDKFPLTLELTFSSHEVESAGVQLPHPADMPNDRNGAEFRIAFS